jgi:hypothetical protein
MTTRLAYNICAYYVLQDGRTALALCADRGHDEETKWLLSVGADPKLADKVGLWSCFHNFCAINRQILRVFCA